MPFFLWESLRGGIDVALRTVVPKMRIQPGFSALGMRLLRADACVFLANCMSLLPGTLVADMKEEQIRVHLIDVDMDADKELRRPERAVARVFPEPPCFEDMRSC